MKKIIFVIMLIMIAAITGCGSGGGTRGSTDVISTGEPGTIKWEFSPLSGYFIGSNPAIGVDGTIYVGNNDGKLYAINPDGSLRWSLLPVLPSIPVRWLVTMEPYTLVPGMVASMLFLTGN